MAILNYTTTVDAEKSVGEILRMLAKGGAQSIMANYGPGGKPLAISFAVQTPFGVRTFTLPIAANRVLAVMRRDRLAPRFLSMEHAERVAWRIVKDWLETGAFSALVLAPFVLVGTISDYRVRRDAMAKWHTEQCGRAESKDTDGQARAPQRRL